MMVEIEEMVFLNQAYFLLYYAYHRVGLLLILLHKIYSFCGHSQNDTTAIDKFLWTLISVYYIEIN